MTINDTHAITHLVVGNHALGVLLLNDCPLQQDAKSLMDPGRVAILL